MTSYPDPLLPLALIPQVALKSMNQTHREEVALINALAARVAMGMDGEADEQAVTDQLEALLAHTRQHFARENELMLQHGFPAYPVHSAEHQRVLGLLETLLQGWLEEKRLSPLVDFLFTEWPAWFDNHLLTMDKVTAGFLRQQGVEPE
ncbi:MAG: hemerythrin family protein [Candidatus Thiodiazotropha sp.]